MWFRFETKILHLNIFTGDLYVTWLPHVLVPSVLHRNTSSSQCKISGLKNVSYLTKCFMSVCTCKSIKPVLIASFRNSKLSAAFVLAMITIHSTNYMLIANKMISACVKTIYEQLVTLKTRVLHTNGALV